LEVECGGDLPFLRPTTASSFRPKAQPKWRNLRLSLSTGQGYKQSIKNLTLIHVMKMISEAKTKAFRRSFQSPKSALGLSIGRFNDKKLGRIEE
jgi:hypothetical protein